VWSYIGAEKEVDLSFAIGIGPYPVVAFSSVEVFVLSNIGTIGGSLIPIIELSIMMRIGL
jgi:hypothetical protein